MKKSLKLIITVSCVLIAIIIIVSSLFFLHINKVGNLIKNNDFETAKTMLDNSKLLTSIGKPVLLKTINNKTESYRVSDFDDVIDFTEDDWNTIVKYNDFLDSLSFVSDEDEYMSKLVELSKHKDTFAAYKWYKSNDYSIWRSYIDNNDLSNVSSISMFKSLLEKYSFEEYGAEENYIKELENERSSLVENLDRFINAYNSYDVRNFEDAKTKIVSSCANLGELELKLLFECSDIDKLVKDILN